MKRFFRITSMVLAMLLTMLVFALLTLRIALHAGESTVPDFSSLTVGEASDAALRNSLDLTIENKFYSTTVPAGRILSQAPSPGSRVRQGWQVRVTESLGPQQVTIPDVSGQTVREASMALRRDSLDLGTMAHLDAPGDPDMVIAQTPPPDAGVDQPRVSLLLSSSSSGASSAFVLPSFVGLSYHDASRQAAALGLRTAPVGQTTTAATTTPTLPPGAHPGPNGTMLDANNAPLALPSATASAAASGPSGPVLSQSPEAGFRANRGDTIKLTFAHITVAAPPPADPNAPAAASSAPGSPAASPGAPTAATKPAKPLPPPTNQAARSTTFGTAGAPPSPKATH